MNDINEWDDESENDESHRFILFWDMHGLETVFDMDGAIQRRVEAALKDQTHTEPDIGSLIHKLKIRAQYNTSRNYEMYAIAMPPGVTELDIWDMFEKNAQNMADLIRQRGVKLYGSMPSAPICII